MTQSLLIAQDEVVFDSTVQAEAPRSARQQTVPYLASRAQYTPRILLDEVEVQDAALPLPKMNVSREQGLMAAQQLLFAPASVVSNGQSNRSNGLASTEAALAALATLPPEAMILMTMTMTAKSQLQCAGLQAEQLQDLQKTMWLQVQKKIEEYAKQLAASTKQMEKAHTMGIVSVVFDWVMAVAEVGFGVAEIVGGVFSGNALWVVAGFADISAGELGFAKASLETVALVQERHGNTARAKELQAKAHKVGYAQMACEVVSAAVGVVTIGRAMWAARGAVTGFRVAFVGSEVGFKISEFCVNAARLSLTEVLVAAEKTIKGMALPVMARVEAAVVTSITEGIRALKEVRNLTALADISLEGLDKVKTLEQLKAFINS